MPRRKEDYEKNVGRNINGLLVSAVEKFCDIMFPQKPKQQEKEKPKPNVPSWVNPIFREAERRRLEECQNSNT